MPPPRASPSSRRHCASLRALLNVTDGDDTIVAHAHRDIRCPRPRASRTAARDAGSPTAWIFTSYWSDQKYGTAAYGSGSNRLRPTCVPCSAAFVQCSIRIELAVRHRMRPDGDVSRGPHVRGGLRNVASHTTPRSSVRPRALEPLDVRDRAERDHDHVGVAASYADRGRAAAVQAAMLRAAGHPCARCSSAQRSPSSGPSAVIGCSAMSISVTSSPSLRALDATSQPMNPAPTIATLRAVLERRLSSSASSRSRTMYGVVRRLARPRRARVPVAITSCSYAIGSSPSRHGLAPRRRAPSPSRRAATSTSRSSHGKARCPAIADGRRAAPSRAAGACTACAAPRPRAISSPSQPDARTACAARRPASDAPTTTIISSTRIASIGHASGRLARELGLGRRR